MQRGGDGESNPSTELFLLISAEYAAVVGKRATGAATFDGLAMGNSVEIDNRGRKSAETVCSSDKVGLFGDADGWSSLTDDRILLILNDRSLGLVVALSEPSSLCVTSISATFRPMLCTPNEGERRPTRKTNRELRCSNEWHQGRRELSFDGGLLDTIKNRFFSRGQTTIDSIKRPFH